MAEDKEIPKASQEILEYEAAMTKEHGPRVGHLTEEMLLSELAKREGFRKCIGVLIGTPDNASEFRVIYDKKEVSNYEMIDLLKHAGAHFDNMRARGLMMERQGVQPRPPPPTKP